MKRSVVKFNNRWIVSTINMAKNNDGNHVRVGYPTGIPVAPPTIKGSGHEPFTSVSDLATIAAVHEFGSVKKNIPARPTIVPTIERKKKKEIVNLIGRLAGAVMTGKMTYKKAINVLGVFVKSEIQNAITELWEPALSPITIRLKKSTKPLIDRGQMRASVNYTVHTGKDQ